MQLRKNLSKLVRQHGSISFADFMQQALYAPNLGYYSAGLQKFGSYGDFITAPEMTPLFAQTLANQCQQVLSALKNPCLLEFGAGSGRLCIDLLKQLEKLNCLPDTYIILEVSGSLRQRQQESIHQEIPHLANIVQWISAWPEQPFAGVVLANEVLDAMPVHRFLQTNEGIFESHIKLNENDELIEAYIPCTNALLIKKIQAALPPEISPYQSEVNLFIDDWFFQCHAMLSRGAVFIIDYGFPRHEYYHHDRNQGTLMCHFHHQAHTNPLINIGEQDITAHVDFTHVAEAAYDAGFHIAGYTNQAAFLLSNGLLSLLSNTDSIESQIKNQQAVKQLTHPSEMGELFKVIALTKNIDFPLNGFQLQDKRASL